MESTQNNTRQAQGTIHTRLQALEVQQARKNKKDSSANAKTFPVYHPVEPIQQLTSGAATVAWTSFSVADYVPQGTKAILLTARLRTGVLGGTVTMTIDARMDGSSSTRNILTNTNLVGTDTQTNGGNWIPVGPGASFEYQVTASAGNPASFDITLEGYICP